MTKRIARDLVLWVSFLAGPIFWLISFQAKYAWVPLACAAQSKVALLAYSIVALALTAIAGTFAWREWRNLQSDSPEESGPVLARSRFMAVSAMVFCAGFFLVILAQMFPDLILESCQ